MGRDEGLNEEKLTALDRYEDSRSFSDAEKLVLRLADAMTGLPAEVPDSLFESLRSYLNEQQIVELASAIAWENYRARFNRVFEVESEDFSEGAFCPLPVQSGAAGGHE